MWMYAIPRVSWDYRPIADVQRNDIWQHRCWSVSWQPTRLSALMFLAGVGLRFLHVYSYCSVRLMFR